MEITKLNKIEMEKPEERKQVLYLKGPSKELHQKSKEGERTKEKNEA